MPKPNKKTKKKQTIINYNNHNKIIIWVTKADVMHEKKQVWHNHVQFVMDCVRVGGSGCKMTPNYSFEHKIWTRLLSKDVCMAQHYLPWSLNHEYANFLFCTGWVLPSDLGKWVNLSTPVPLLGAQGGWAVVELIPTFSILGIDWWGGTTRSDMMQYKWSRPELQGWELWVYIC